MSDLRCMRKNFSKLRHNEQCEEGPCNGLSPATLRRSTKRVKGRSLPRRRGEALRLAGRPSSPSRRCVLDRLRHQRTSSRLDEHFLDGESLANRLRNAGQLLRGVRRLAACRRKRRRVACRRRRRVACRKRSRVACRRWEKIRATRQRTARKANVLPDRGRKRRSQLRKSLLLYQRCLPTK